LPTIDELRAYIISNPSAFIQWNNMDRWTPVVSLASQETVTQVSPESRCRLGHPIRLGVDRHS
jgi:hypothetical protein